jgi:hypothetical protein
MRPIRAQLCTWWKRIAGTNWITAVERLRLAMDWGRRWLKSDGSRPEMDRGMIWIATGYGRMTRDGSWETDDNQSPSLLWRY